MLRALLVLLFAASCAVEAVEYEDVEAGFVGEGEALLYCPAPPDAAQNTNVNLTLGYPLLYAVHVVNTRPGPVDVVAKVAGPDGACNLSTPRAYLQGVLIGYDDPIVVSYAGQCAQVSFALFPGADAHLYTMAATVHDMGDPAQLQVRFF